MEKKFSINTLSDQITFLIATELILAGIAYSIIGILALLILLDALFTGRLFCSFDDCLIDKSNGLYRFYIQFIIAFFAYVITMLIGFRTLKKKWKKLKARRVLVDRFNFIMAHNSKTNVVESK